MNDPHSAPLMAYILAKLFVLYLMYLVVKKVLKIVGINFDKPKYPEYYPRESLFANSIKSMLKFVFIAPFKFIAFLFGLKSSEEDPADAFMSFRQERTFFKSSNKGLLLDGINKRISKNVSFEHLAVVGATGRGKSRGLVIPNILSIDNASIVVTDLGGGLYRKTSGYMQKRGYKIQVLNLNNVENSMRYNPFVYATDSKSIKQLASILVETYSAKSKSDPFWNTGAKNILNILISCLVKHDIKYANLANLAYLLDNFGDKGDGVKDFISKNVPNDEIWNKFVGLRSKKELGSILSTAIMSIDSMTDQDMLLLTSENTVDFEVLRDKKTIFYLIVPERDLKYYSPIVNIFYTQFFSALMKGEDNKSKLPIYMLLDEFGHFEVNDFPAIITTIRKYDISVSIFLQNLNQLEGHYGKGGAGTILKGGINSKMYLSGIDSETAFKLEKRLGTYRKKYRVNDQDQYVKENVRNASDITEMKDNQALYFYANKKPVELNIQSAYESSKFSKMLNKTPFSVHGGLRDYIDYVSL